MWSFGEKNLKKLIRPCLRLTVRTLVLLDTSLPLCGFAFCILWCLFYEFERSTATHCEVSNYLPSVSAVTSLTQQQRLVWRLVAVVHFLVQLAVARMYVLYFNKFVNRNLHGLVVLACALHIIESMAVMGITFWTSTENITLHSICFGLVICCGAIYMCCSYLLLRYGKKLPLLPIEEKSLRYKGRLILLNMMSACTATYCYVRHNMLCEPGMYTLFALFEYIYIFSNMLFHMTAYFDLCP